MRIFIKNINETSLYLLKDFPVHGLIFTIEQDKAEKIRDIIEKIPFYIPILGEIGPMPQYEAEELIFFCRLSAVITNKDYHTSLSRPIIHTEQKNLSYNALLQLAEVITTANIDIKDENYIKTTENLLAVAFTEKDFLDKWPVILHYWSNDGVV